MITKAAEKRARQLTNMIREQWTRKWLKYGKQGDNWREPFETMYRHVESKRKILEGMYLEEKITNEDYLSLKDSCDRLQLELYLFLGDERQIDMMKTSWDSGNLPVGYFYKSDVMAREKARKAAKHLPGQVL